MNSQSKAYSIILYLIWPFSAFFVGLKNFDSVVGKNLLIAFYAFVGFTAVSVGDLERYEAEFYRNKAASIDQIVTEFLDFQDGKIFYSVASVFTGSIFDSHHYYFAILFLVYGYFYINTVYLLKDISYKKLGKFGLMFVFGVLLFILIRPVINTAYYTGGVFILYMTVSFYKHNKVKYLWYMLLAPLFHIGLTVYVVVPLFLIFFKNKTRYYILFVIVSFLVGKSSVVGVMEDVSKNSDSILEIKYKNYASEDGQAYMEERYADGAANSNIKLRSLNFLTDAIMYFFIPLGVALLYLKRKFLLVDQDLKTLFHIVLIFLGISNLMLNISQGERFLVLYAFLAIGLFYTVYIRTRNLSMNTVFMKFLVVFVPILFVTGLMLLYASNELFISQVFISNFFIEIYNYS